MRKSFVKIKDIRAYYEKDGKGSSALVLHGWGGNTDSIRPIFDILKKNFTTYSIDLPGFGRSSIPPLSWKTQDYGLFIKEFLNNFKIEKMDLIGHSFGGKIGIFLASNYPSIINRLVLISPSGLKPKRKFSYYLKVFIGKIAKKLPNSIKDKIYEKIGSPDYKTAGKMRPILINVLKEDFKPLLPKISSNTLIIWGEDDKEIPLYQGRIMEREIPNSRLEIIKNGGHFCYLDQPQYFSSILIDFLC